MPRVLEDMTRRCDINNRHHLFNFYAESWRCRRRCAKVLRLGHRQRCAELPGNLISQASRPGRAPESVHLQVRHPAFKRQYGSVCKRLLVNGRPILDLDRTQPIPEFNEEWFARRSYSWNTFSSIDTSSKARVRSARIRHAVLKFVSKCFRNRWAKE